MIRYSTRKVVTGYWDEVVEESKEKLYNTTATNDNIQQQQQQQQKLCNVEFLTQLYHCCRNNYSILTTEYKLKQEHEHTSKLTSKQQQCWCTENPSRRGTYDAMKDRSRTAYLKYYYYSPAIKNLLSLPPLFLRSAVVGN